MVSQIVVECFRKRFLGVLAAVHAIDKIRFNMLDTLNFQLRLSLSGVFNTNNLTPRLS
jgi:hypothetical protein